MIKKIVKKVFIVDDNELFSIALKDFITDQTQNLVEIYNTGEECIRHLATGRPDVVILDYYLDGVDKNAANGAQILEEIKKLDYSIHVIMLSAQDAYGTALQTITKGAEEYVVKDDDSFEKIVHLLNNMN